MTHDEEARSTPEDERAEREEESSQADGTVQEEPDSLGSDVASRHESILRARGARDELPSALNRAQPRPLGLSGPTQMK